MNREIYTKIVSKTEKGEKMLVVLLDPEKCINERLDKTLFELKKKQPDFIFVGGSTKKYSTDTLLEALKDIDVPTIVFPGDVSQFSNKADALLLLSLLSGDNPDYLIGQQRRGALDIKKSKVEVIPTAYLLIDGGKKSSVERVSKTEPISRLDIGEVVSTSVAGELLGMKLVYLEAGSGALLPISSQMISAVKNELDIPLIVGGGIRTEKALKRAYESGADIVVIGNLFETESKKISSFISLVEKINEESKK
ncbi:MAG: geranylgeranylglyceryl/heptaprenylglyceryl phosphate synthase [Paludibacter sp.]|nr:MAG: geranylgeranylglyceryl/heptaprenylglyceryl phosphate synthase [Paludibacter sp.]